MKRAPYSVFRDTLGEWRVAGIVRAFRTRAGAMRNATLHTSKPAKFGKNDPLKATLARRRNTNRSGSAVEGQRRRRASPERKSCSP